jgi:hypothetical protein
MTLKLVNKHRGHIPEVTHAIDSHSIAFAYFTGAGVVCVIAFFTA